MKKIGIIGSGVVAKTLGSGFLKQGHEVMLGTRSIDKLSEWKDAQNGAAFVGSFEETAQFGDVLVLAVKGTVAKDVLKTMDRGSTQRKTIIDATNPIDNQPPEAGVLRFFTDQNDSLMEQLQAIHPEANFVKAYNSVGSAQMVNPSYEVRPTMFICGNNPEAKKEVESINTAFGWETQDMGSAQAARAIEPLCMLWCIPGFLNNEWTHAFKLLKK